MSLKTPINPTIAQALHALRNPLSLEISSKETPRMCLPEIVRHIGWLEATRHLAELNRRPKRPDPCKEPLACATAGRCLRGCAK